MHPTSPTATLADENFAAGQLLQLLQQEQECLVGGNVDALEKLVPEKAAVVARMTELAQRRYRALAEAGHEAGEAGMKTWLAKPGAADDAQRAWNALLATAESAKELNRVNGMLINQHLARNQGALNILHGTPQTGNLYGPNGQSTLGKGRRSLVVG